MLRKQTVVLHTTDTAICRSRFVAKKICSVTISPCLLIPINNVRLLIPETLHVSSWLCAQCLTRYSD